MFSRESDPAYHVSAAGLVRVYSNYRFSVNMESIGFCFLITGRNQNVCSKCPKWKPKSQTSRISISIPIFTVSFHIYSATMTLVAHGRFILWWQWSYDCRKTFAQVVKAFTQFHSQAPTFNKFAKKWSLFLSLSRSWAQTRIMKIPRIFCERQLFLTVPLTFFLTDLFSFVEIAWRGGNCERRRRNWSTVARTTQFRDGDSFFRLTDRWRANRMQYILVFKIIVSVT